MLRFLLLYRIASYCRQPGGGPALAQRRSQERAEAATQEKGQKGMLFGKGMNFLLLSVKGPWASSSGSIQVSFPKSPSSFFFSHVFWFFNLRFLRALLFTSFCWPSLYAFCDSISSLHPCTLAPYFFSVPDAYILLRASLSALHFDNLVCRLSTSLNAPFW